MSEVGIVKWQKSILMLNVGLQFISKEALKII